MSQAHFTERLYSHYLADKKTPKQPSEFLEYEHLTDEERKTLSKEHFLRGKELLEKNDPKGIDYFASSCFLDPNNAENFFKQGQVLLECGKKNSVKKMLFQANQNFKLATKIYNEMLHAYWSWGESLQLLGDMLQEEHYYQKAKEKLSQAINLAEAQPKAILAKLYWDFALVWHKIATHSGEAIDVRKAIQSMKKSLSLHSETPLEFWYDFGNIHLQMALLINDKQIYYKALEYFEKTVAKNPAFANGWVAIAESYTQLFINTLDEKCFQKADDAFIKAAHLLPKDSSLFLQWAQLLGESGKLTQNPKKLRASMDKCQKALKYDRNNPLIIGQWIESQSLLGTFSNRVDLIIEAENKVIDLSEKYEDLPDIWYAFGICMRAYAIYYDDLDYEEIAIEKFQTGLSLDRTSAESWYALGLSFSTLGLDSEDETLLEKACKFFHQANHLKPACSHLLFDYAKTLYHLGKMTEQQTDIEKAVDLFETILHSQNEVILQHPEWLFYYGLSLDQLGDSFDHEDESCYAKAIEVLHNVLLIDPDFSHIHFQLALCYTHLAEITLNREFFQKAITFFHLSSKQNDEDEELYLEWGLTLISLARVLEEPFTLEQLYSEAEQKLLRAGQLGNQQVYYHLACLYSLRNKIDKAFDLLHQAKQFDVLPTIEEILQDDWLENIQSTPLFSQFIAELDQTR